MRSPHTTCLLSIIALLVVAAFGLHTFGPSKVTAQERAPKNIHTNSPNVHLSTAPLTFEANQGQAAKSVKFISRGLGYNLSLTTNEAVLSLHSPATGSRATLQMSLLAANQQPTMHGIEELPGKTHFFVGNDPQQWQRNIVNYAKVKYSSVYPGIDLLYYGNQNQLEYDFVVQPGADPRAIQIKLQGARQMRIDATGDLVLTTDAGEVRQHKPVLYQEINGARRSVTGNYVLENNRIRFAIGEYDPNYALVIDPVISYATLLSSTGDGRRAIAVDSQGNAYVTGSTNRDSFLTTKGALNQGDGQPSMVFVTKLSQDGRWPVYTAVFGGTTGIGNTTPGNNAAGIAVDAQGNAIVAGSTLSSDFPTTANAYKKTTDNTDAFVLKLNATGSEILFATLVGGSQTDNASGIALDSAGNLCLAGGTNSPDFPNTDTRYKKLDASGAAFVARLNPNGSSLLHANILDSAGGESAVGIAVDAAGNLYFTGTTSDGYVNGQSTLGTRFPRTGGAYDFDFSPISPFGEAVGGVQPGVFVAKVRANGKLAYSSIIGAGQASGIVADRTGNAFIVGRSNFIAKTGDYNTPSFKSVPVFPETDRTMVNTVDPHPQYGPISGGMFLAELNPMGNELLLSHRIEADDTSGTYGIAIDQQDYLHITGRVSISFPLAHGVAMPLENLFNLYPYTPANKFAFYLKVDPSGKTFVETEFLRSASGRAIAVDIAGNAYVSGTAGAGFSATPNAFQTTLPEGATPTSHFVAKFGNEPIPGAVLVKATATVSGQITNNKGEGLAGATVKIRGDRLANTITQVTGQDGKYSLPNIPKGANYILEAKKAGYELLAPQSLDGDIVLLNLLTTDQVVNFITNREPSIAVVNAANYRNTIALGSIASAFGDKLALTVRSASSRPLPTVLGIVTVIITDSQGKEKPAPLFYVSPTQINFQVPEDLATGEAEVKINSNGRISLGAIMLEAIAPGIFSADSTGRGVAAADMQCVMPDGKQTFSSLVKYNEATGSFTPVAIDLNAAEQTYLVMYGTGIRLRSQMDKVRARLGGTELPVSYAGAQGDFVGVDQVNLLLPKTLAGAGNVNIDLIVDGKIANTVSVKIK